MMKKILSCVIVLLLTVGISYAAPIKIPKTGVATSYSPGDDGALQKGVAWPSPRFTDNGGGTVTDNLTGLMWTKDANLAGNKKVWQDALDYVADMNAGKNKNFGHTDWRLPNRRELKSLVDAWQYNPALPADHPFTNVVPYQYWSSTSHAGLDNHAWRVNMWDGYTSGMHKVYNAYPAMVWPVRGKTGSIVKLPVTGQTKSYAKGDDGSLKMGAKVPNTRFKDNKDGTVTDNLTGLMWTKNANLHKDTVWQDALDYIADMNAGKNKNFSHTDWRLPNLNELGSLIDLGYAGPALTPGHPFTGVQHFCYWTSSNYKNFDFSVWGVNLWDGEDYFWGKSYIFNVWPVRGGQ
ncbi:MAG: DUF1566 domain-containing protein [Nitrospinota bacterium]